MTVPADPAGWSGVVVVSGHDGPDPVERFHCSQDAGGWWWRGERSDPGTGAPLGRLELRLDEAGVTRRLQVESGGWLLRGGCVGPEVLWRRGEQEGEQVGDGFWGTSPAYTVAAVRRARLEVGQSCRLRLLAVLEPALALRTVDTAWVRVTEDLWRVDDLATGERREVRLCAGTVVAGTGWTFTES